MLRTIRSILAVVGAFVASAVVVTLVGMAKGALTSLPPSGPLVPMRGLEFAGELAIYGSLGLVGGFVASMLAPSNAENHGYAVAALILLLTLSDQRHELHPTHRIQLAVAGVVAIACCVLAARLVGARRVPRQHQIAGVSK